MKRYRVAIEYYFDAEDEEHALEQFLDAVSTVDPNVVQELKHD